MTKEKEIKITKEAIVKHLLTSAELDLMIYDVDNLRFDHTIEYDKEQIIRHLEKDLTKLQKEWPQQTDTDLKGFIKEVLETYNNHMEDGFEYVEVGLKEILETIGRGLIYDLEQFYSSIDI